MTKSLSHPFFSVQRRKVTAQGAVLECDRIPVEEPLLIQCASDKGDDYLDFSLTLRTPGDDAALVRGLLFTERVIEKASEMTAIEVDSEQNDNLIRVRLTDESWQKFQRNEAAFRRRHPSYGGCGLCGKTHLQALELNSSRQIISCSEWIGVETVRRIRHLLALQPLFAGTGGTHVAGFLPASGHELLWDQACFFEDVGRHNALDKLVGSELQHFDLQRQGILLLSGRVGFELVQKAVIAGFGNIVALGAPTQLAVKAAVRFGICLAGFAKDHQFNLYSEGTQTRND